MPNLLVNVIFRCLDLWNSFWVSDEPEDLITGEGERHEDEQGLIQVREWETGWEVELKYRFSTTCKEGWTNFVRICLPLLFVYYLSYSTNYILLIIQNSQHYCCAVSFTFGPRRPGSSSSTLRSSFSAPLKKCLLSLWIAPLEWMQKIKMFVCFSELINSFPKTIFIRKN